MSAEHVARRTSPIPCEVWTDHQWSDLRLIETGRHPTMGAYYKYVVVCERCEKQTTETHWLDLLAPRRPAEP